MTKRIFIILIIICGICCPQLYAQTANDVINKVISSFQNSKGVSADYVVSSSQSVTRGNIVMNGVKFRIISNDLKSWYDGKTQWTYSSVSDEVNVTTPTQSDLQMSNPYIAIMSLKNTCNMSLSSKGTSYVVVLTPKKKESFSSVTLTISKSVYQIHNVVFVMNDNTKYTIAISNYATGKNFPQSTFTYDKSLVPSETQVVDLR